MEAGVFGSYSRLDGIRRDFVVTDENTVFVGAKGGEDLSVVGENLGNKDILGILYFISLRKVGEENDGSNEKEEQGERS